MGGGAEDDDLAENSNDLDSEGQRIKKTKPSVGNGSLSAMDAIDMIRSLLSEKTAKLDSKAVATPAVVLDDDKKHGAGDGMDDQDLEDELSIDHMSDAEAKHYEAVSTKHAGVNGAKHVDMELDSASDEKSSPSSSSHPNGGLKRDPSKKEFDEPVGGDAEEATIIASAAHTAASAEDLEDHHSMNGAAGSKMDVISTQADSKGTDRKVSAAKSLSVDIEEDTSTNNSPVNGRSTPVRTVTRGSPIPAGILDPHRYNNPAAVYDSPALINGNTMVCKLKDHK